MTVGPVDNLMLREASEQIGLDGIFWSFCGIIGFHLAQTMVYISQSFFRSEKHKSPTQHFNVVVMIVVGSTDL